MATPTPDANVSTIGPAGLAIESLPNIILWLQQTFAAIYGADINVDSNSPDGQLINILGQSIIDQLELLLATYNLSAVPTSFGTRLDQLVALNGLARIQGTQTLSQVVVTITQALTLPGLDQTAIPAFTVADQSGNQYQLVTSYVAASAGTPTLTFQAVTIGQIQTVANTITTIITATLGVPTVNNPSTSADIIGVNEETDTQLKIRQAQSFQLASTGPSDAMESLLRNTAGIVDAYVVENNTVAPVNTIPANSVWIIVNGGTPTTIAAAIYAKKSPGCGMKGSVTQIVMRPNGSTFLAKWDVAISQNLYVKFSIIWNGPVTMSDADIETALAAVLVYRLGQNPSVSDVVIAMQSIAPTAIVTFNSASQGVSVDNSAWESIVEPSDAQHYFGTSSVSIV